MTDEPRRILLYCPEGGVQPHHVSTLTLGRILESRGHRVDVAYCEGLYERCVVMNSISAPPVVPREQFAPLCGQCSLQARHAIHSVGMRLVDMVPYHKPQDLYEAARLVEHCEDPVSLVHDGIAFGALARHDLFLARKLLADQPLDASDFARLRETVRSALVVYFAIRRMVAERGYTHLLVFGHYAVNSAAAFAARSEGISWRFVSNPAHCNIDRRRLTLDSINGCEIALRFLRSWPDWRDVPLTADEVLEVGRDILHRFSGVGSHTYSPAKMAVDPLELLGLRRDRKLILALTSSLDERQASAFLEKAWSPDLDCEAIGNSARSFPDQISWLTGMCDWASARDDMQLVIRVHPREGPNKRDGVSSSHLQRLRAALVDLPGNVRVIWPEDQLSTYDLMEAAHLIQCSWSTVGMEAARLGVPVMTSDPYDFPAGDFLKGASSPEQFFRLTEELLAEGPSLERILFGLRFYCMTRLQASVSIEDINPDIHGISPRRFESAVGAEILEELLLRPVGAEEIKRAARPAAAAETFAVEQAAVLYLLRALIRYTFTGDTAGDDYNLILIPTKIREDALPQPKGGEAFLLLDGEDCEFVTPEGSVRRHSPMVARMAALCRTHLVVAPSPILATGA
jgi:hypothetical protein